MAATYQSYHQPYAIPRSGPDDYYYPTMPSPSLTGYYAPSPPPPPSRLPPPMTLHRTGHWYNVLQPLHLTSLTTNLHLSETPITIASRPNLSLHRGTNRDATPIASLKTHLLRDSELGLSDLSTGRVSHWTTLRPDHYSGRTDFTVPGTAPPRHLAWYRAEKRRFGHRVRDDKRALQLADETGQVLAVFNLIGFHGKDRGSVKWLRPVTEREEMASLMVLMGVYVHERERAKKGKPGGRGKGQALGHFDLDFSSGGDTGGGGWFGGDSGGGGWGGGGGDGGGGGCSGGGGGGS
ncbi:hypothetical protein KVT40_005596 [Elsinoe batatas]|uniref:Uncharacterized protein n=1 Tax=Elsinoe batatas TaxID=2601811 RepID=A0A8K0KYT5_9PEZI|nr:hypothetical protein KVT40_005596 [Elsinoe batatas]